jgi:pimeloyl-ACP methyl ester carboxylesterase
MKASATVKSVELGEYRINYASEGTGPTMIMLHGSDKREDWKVWEPLMALSKDFSLVIPDLVGFGRSTIPVETPDYKVQARGGQVALEVAINWPQSVDSLVLISSTYDKPQLLRLKKMKRPTLIIWAEDNLVAQLKAGYLLRDSIMTSRIEVLGAVAKNPNYDFTIAHKLERYKKDVIISLVRDFLSSPSEKIAEPPELEPELKGLAMKEQKEEES